jgi:zinc/manganese transport system permease protein
MSALLATAGTPPFTWAVWRDVHDMLSYPFMVNAFRAGTVVAVLAGVVGWYVVLRRETFAAHTLAVVGYPGAAGAVLVGAAAGLGLYVAAVGAALVIALLPGLGGRGRGEESAVTGTVQAFALACGFLFVSLSTGFLDNGTALLFGSFLGITSREVLVLLLVAVAVLGVLAVVARPLLFASLDPAVAAARGVRVRPLATAFLVLVGFTAASVAQVTGTLLVFALMVVPAAVGQAISPRPRVSVGVTVAVGVLVVWLSLYVGYHTTLPLGFLVTTWAFVAYIGARGLQRLRAGRAA